MSMSNKCCIPHKAVSSLCIFVSCLFVFSREKSPIDTRCRLVPHKSAAPPLPKFPAQSFPHLPWEWSVAQSHPCILLLLPPPCDNILPPWMVLSIPVMVVSALGWSTSQSFPPPLDHLHHQCCSRSSSYISLGQISFQPLLILTTFLQVTFAGYHYLVGWCFIDIFIYSCLYCLITIVRCRLLECGPEVPDF